MELFPLGIPENSNFSFKKGVENTFCRIEFSLDCVSFRNFSTSWKTFSGLKCSSSDSSFSSSSSSSSAGRVRSFPEQEIYLGMTKTFD